MISRFNSLYLSASLALSVFVTQPIMADEANKKIEFEFAAPVQIPGHVLAPGKYVFELMDTAFSDRNMVQIFSEDSNGKEILIATISAIPDYTSNTPEKATIHFEERHCGHDTDRSVVEPVRRAAGRSDRIRASWRSLYTDQNVSSTFRTYVLFEA